MNRGLSGAALVLLPMALALAGACIDERSHLGYSNWIAACRSAGITPASAIAFTGQLLPTAIAGALLGGLIVQAIGVCWRHHGCAAHAALAAHAGCALAMVLGLLLCTLSLSVSAMLVTEALAALGAAFMIFQRLQRTPARRIRKSPYPTGRM